MAKATASPSQQRDGLLQRHLLLAEGGGLVAHFAGLLAGVEEVGAGALGAAHAVGAENLPVDHRDAVPLLHQPGVQPHVRPERAHRLAVAHLHLGRHAGGLQLVEDHPAAYLVQQRRLDAAVQRVDPAHEVRVRPPHRDDLLAVPVETHAHAPRVPRAAPETVVSFRFPYPGIDNGSHVFLFKSPTLRLSPCVGLLKCCPFGTAQ